MTSATLTPIADLAVKLQEGVPLDVTCYRINDELNKLKRLPGELRIYPLDNRSDRIAYEKVEDLIRHMLPGWGWRTCQCYLSTDAVLFPDYNDPQHGERLLAAYPPAIWDNRAEIDLDIRPPISSAGALCAALLVTLATILQDREAAAKAGADG